MASRCLLYASTVLDQYNPVMPGSILLAMLPFLRDLVYLCSITAVLLMTKRNSGSEAVFELLAGYGWLTKLQVGFHHWVWARGNKWSTNTYGYICICTHTFVHRKTHLFLELDNKVRHSPSCCVVEGRNCMWLSFPLSTLCSSWRWRKRCFIYSILMSPLSIASPHTSPVAEILSF